MHGGGKNKKQLPTAGRMAVAGLFCALSLIFLLFGSYISIGTYFAPMLAGLCLLPVTVELGKNWALLSFAGVSLLSFFLVSDIEMLAIYLLFFGYFPIIYPSLGKILNKFLQYFVKLLIFNLAAAFCYTFLYFLFPGSLQVFSSSPYSVWLYLGFFLALNCVFILYNRLLGLAYIIYHTRIRRHFVR